MVSCLFENREQNPIGASRIGPTEAIRVILGKHPDGLTPVQIREELAGYGISCGSDKNFLGNIHNIVKRSKDIEQIGVGGSKLYKLKVFRPTLGAPNPTNTR